MAFPLKLWVSQFSSPTLWTRVLPPAEWTLTTKSGLIRGSYSEDVTLSGSSVTQILDLSDNGFVTECPHTSTPPFGDPPLFVSNVLNGRPALRFGTRSGGAFDVLSYPTGNAIIGSAIPFGICGVIQPTALTTGQFYSILNLSGGSPSESGTVYFTSPSFGSRFYWQVGNTSCDVIGNLTDYDQSAPHSFVFNYNGSGRSNAANYQLFINGVDVGVKHSTASGGGVAYNWIGNQGVGSISVGDLFIPPTIYNSPITGSDLTGFNAMVASRYGLGV